MINRGILVVESARWLDADEDISKSHPGDGDVFVNREAPMFRKVVADKRGKGGQPI